MKWNIVFLLMLICFFHVVNAQQKPQLVVEKGNNRAIHSARYSPDGRYIIVTCPDEGTVKIWETASGRLISTLTANAGDAWYSESGRYIVTEAADAYNVYDNNHVFLYTVRKPAASRSLYLYDVYDDNQVITYQVKDPLAGSGILSFASHEKWIVIPGNDSAVNICDAGNGKIIRSITNRHNNLLVARLCDDDKRLILLSADNTVSLTDLNNDSLLYERKIPGSRPKTIVVSSQGSYAAIGWYTRPKYGAGNDSLIITTVLDTRAAKELFSPYSVAAFSPDESSLLLQRKTHDTEQTAVGLPDGKILFNLPIGDGGKIIYSGNGKQIYGYVSDSLQTFNSKTGQKSINIYIPDGYVSQALVMKKNLEVEILHPRYHENGFELPPVGIDSPHLSYATCSSVSPDGKKIALGFVDGTVAELGETSAAHDSLMSDGSPESMMADRRFSPVLPGIELSRVLHDDGITLFTDAFASVIDAAYVPHRPYPYIFTKTGDNLGIIWNNQDLTIRYKNDLNYFGNIYSDLEDYLGNYYTVGIKQMPSVFTPDGRFFLLTNATGKTLWRTDSLVKIFPKPTEGQPVNDADILFHEFAASPDGLFTCDIGRHDEADPERLTHIYRMDANSSAKKEIHTMRWSTFFRYEDPYDERGMAVKVAFAGDSRHLVQWFAGQKERSPFRTKLVKLPDGISILSINPYMRQDDSGMVWFDTLHASYSKGLGVYVVYNKQKLYWVSAINGQIVKTLPVQLKKPSLTESLDFDPDVKLAYYKDSADGKIYAVDVKTGKAVYSLQSSEKSFSLASFSPDHTRFLTLAEDGNTVAIWDAATGGYLGGFNGHTTRLLNATYSMDGKFILCCAQDGSYEKRNAYTGQLIYTFFLFRDYDFAIVLPDGYYYSSSRSDVKYLNFRLNNKLYNFSQFDLQFNRPDKILEAMGSTDTTLINAWRGAWIKRISNSGFTVADFDSSKFHVPEASLLNKERMPDISNAKPFSFDFSFSDSLYKIASYNIYVNDVPLYGVDGIKLPKAKNYIKLNQSVLLDSGINKVEIRCTNEKGADSRREAFYITYNPEKKEPSKTWFIGIGINKYSQHHYLPDLMYCVNDIRDLAAAFKTKYSQVEIDTLMNEDASRQNIIALKNRLMQTGVNDRVIISFNGHGIGYQNEFYFATPSLNPQSPAADGISYADMLNLLDSIPARKKLLLIDACHSGEWDADDISGGIVANGLTYTVNNTKAELSRGGSSVEIIDVKADDNRKQFNLYDMMKTAFIDLRKNNGTVVIAASQSRQQALEKRDYGNGLFTHCVLKQFSIPALNVSQLLLRINEEMKSETNRQQSVSRQELSESDWVLW